jgi:hypothetical protein
MKNKNNFISGRTLLVIACTAMGLAACTGVFQSDTTGKPEYHVTSNRPSSQVTVSNEANSAIVEIHSDNGIGSATIKLVRGDWPQSIKMRFFLQGLEGLQFSYDGTVADLSVNTQNMILQGVSVGGEKIEPIDEASDYWMAVSFEDMEGMNVVTPVAGGVIEVQAPTDFINGTYSEFTINWIDFYR